MTLEFLSKCKWAGHIIELVLLDAPTRQVGQRGGRHGGGCVGEHGGRQGGLPKDKTVSQFLRCFVKKIVGGFLEN